LVSRDNEIVLRTISGKAEANYHDAPCSASLRSSELAAILPEYLQQGGRKLQHRMAWSLAGAGLLLALGQGVVQAATITVTTNNPNIAADGQFLKWLGNAG